MRYLACMLTLLILPVVGSAHHSIIAIYSRDSVSEIEGELTDLLWRNPHVFFSITADDGDGGITETSFSLEVLFSEVAFAAGDFQDGEGDNGHQ